LMVKIREGAPLCPSRNALEDDPEARGEPAHADSGAVTWASVRRRKTRARRLRLAGVTAVLAVMLYALASAWR
jgi:hypothetical protein